MDDRLLYVVIVQDCKFEVVEYEKNVPLGKEFKIGVNITNTNEKKNRNITGRITVRAVTMNGKNKGEVFSKVLTVWIFPLQGNVNIRI